MGLQVLLLTVFLRLVLKTALWSLLESAQEMQRMIF